MGQVIMISAHRMLHGMLRDRAGKLHGQSGNSTSVGHSHSSLQVIAALHRTRDK